MLASIGRWSFKHPWLALIIWVAALVGALGASGAVGSAFSASFEIPDSETSDGFDALEEYFGGLGAGQPANIVFKTDRGATDPEVQGAMTALFESVSEIEGVTVESPYAPGSRQISPDGTIGYAQLTLAEDIDQLRGQEIGEEIRQQLPELADTQIEIGGEVLAEFEPPESELIGLSFAVVILIVSFGSVMAMGLPIGTAVFGVGIGVGIITLISNVMEMPDFAIQIGAMIGLGVGIDYALFIVTRYREGLHDGLSPLDATSVAFDTAARAVLFAGTTVVISLLGMLLMGLSFITGLGIGASITVLVTMLASVTLLPAFLGFAGNRLENSRVGHVAAAAVLSALLLITGLGIGNSTLAIGAVGLIAALLIGGFVVPGLKRIIPPREPKPLRDSVWYKWSRLIQARPWLFAIGGTALLLTLAYPVLDLRLGFSDTGNFPEETTTRKAYDLLSEGFGPGFNGPFMAVIELESAQGAQTAMALTQAISDTEGVQIAAGPLPNDPAAPEAAIIQIIPTTSPQDEATSDLVQRLRDDVIPDVLAQAGDSSGIAEVNVTGGPPAQIDFSDYLAQRIVIFFGAVLALSFLLLMMLFRSLLVPLKAVIMNMLSIASAYGIVVAIFQWGWGGDLLGIEPAPIEPFIPMMLFAIVFGLSMDYEVFLLSRVREEFDRTGDPVNSVADGLAATARVISAAAAIMVVVFGAFLLEDMRVIKIFGVGLATAVLIDATLVRMLLVPSTMQLLGAKNWWLPAWLDRIVPSINVEGTSTFGDAHHGGATDHRPTMTGNGTTLDYHSDSNGDSDGDSSGHSNGSEPQQMPVGPGGGTNA